MTRAVLYWMTLIMAASDAARGQEREDPQQADRETVPAKAVIDRLADTPPTMLQPQPRAAVDDSQSLKFRRVYIPERDLLTRVKEGQRYVPMSAREFESRVRRIQASDQSPQAHAARIAYAKYSATLEGDSRLIGKGNWQVNLSGEEAALLSLPGLRLALGDAHWTGEENPASARRRAKLGTTDRGQLALHVERSGTIEFNWFLEGRRDRDGVLTYDLSLAPSTSQELKLTLPSELIPVIDKAIVSAAGDDQDSKRVWTIRLIGQGSSILRLVRKNAQQTPKPLAILRPKLTYELSLQGLQVAAEWRLDVHSAPLEKLVLNLDPELTLIGAKLGDAAISWSETASDSKSKQFVLEFSEPIEGENRVVRLTAIGPLKSDGPWVMPRLEARDVIWQDGTMALLIPAPLSLNRLDLAECRQTKRELLPAPAVGEAIGIQAFTPAAKVTVDVGRRPNRLQLTSATTIDLFGNEARGSHVADIVAEQGEQFELSANVSPDWIIDSVQSSPAGMIADWDRQRGDGTTSRLLIQLAKAVNRDRPLRLTINATRRRAPLGDTLRVNDLRLLTFENVTAVRRLALLRTTTPYQLDLRNADDISRVDRNRLSAAERSLLGDVPRGILFVMDDAAEDMEIRLLEERPRYSASIEARAVVSDYELTESYRLRITPESNELSQVKIHFSQSRKTDINWRIGVGGAQHVVARRLAPEEHVAEGVGAAGEIWEIKLKPSRGGPFVLTGERSSELEASVPLALPSLLNATSQQGVVVVELATEFIPELQQRRLETLATDPPAAGEIQNILGAFEYDPSEDPLVATEPALVLKTGRDPAHRRPAWIWRCALDSWFSQSQSVEHRATLLVESAGRSNVLLTIPAAESQPGIFIDGVRQSALSFDMDKGELEVPLPSGRRFVQIEVDWSAKEASLGAVSSRSVVWPTADIPMLSRYYTVWLPSEYVLADTLAAWRTTPAKTVTWQQRLFGLFGSAEADETFEPWLAHDWSRLGRGRADQEQAWQWSSRFAQQPALHSIDGATAPDDTSRGDSWGQRLVKAWRAETPDADPPQAPLYVHIDALNRVGIVSDATINLPSLPPGHDNATIATLLERAGLVLLVYPRGVLLTSRQWAASWYDPSIASSRQLLFEPANADRSPLPSEQDDTLGEIVPLELWSNLPEGNRPAWSPVFSTHQQTFSREGWVAYEFEWPEGDSKLRMVVVRHQTIVALGLGLFVVTAGMAWRFGGLRLVFNLIVLGVLTGIALAIPATFAPLGAAAITGFLAGHVCRWCWLRVRIAPAQSVDVASTPLAAVVSSLCVALLAWRSGEAFAQSPVLNREARSTPVVDVLIPLDENENAASDTVYLPEAFYEALLAKTRAIPAIEEERYLITSAAYEGVAESPSGRQPNGPQNWQATYTVEVLQSPARVFLALGSEGANLVPDSGTLDGQPLRFGWDAQRKGITLDVEAKGSVTIQLQFRPSVQDTASGIAFAIPPVPEASLRLDLGKVSREPQVFALGGAKSDPQLRRRVAELGPMDQVRITWDEAAARTGPPPQFVVEELSWMRVRPGSAILNTRLAVQVRRGEIEELRLALDDRLQLLPLPGDTPVAATQRVAESGELRLRFARPIGQRATFDLSFVVHGVTGVANFAWPKVELIGAQTSRRYAAYTVDPSLDPVAPLSPGMKSLSAAQFAALWGETEARPLAYELPAEASTWRLEVRPRQPKLTSSYRSVLTAKRSHVAVQSNASINISGGSRFQLCASVPPHLSIDDMEVRDSAGIRPSRWALSNAGMLTVFLDSAATGVLELKLRGRLPVAEDRQLTAPLLKIEDSIEGDHSVAILRQSNVLATIKDRGGLQEISSAEAQPLLATVLPTGTGAPQPSRGALFVAALAGNRSNGSLVLEVAKNQPRIDAMQAITIARSGETWQAVLDLRMNVSGGLLDVVRLDIPLSWTGPYRIEPPIGWEVIEFPAESRRQLLLHPFEPIAGEVQLRVEAPLAATAGQRIHAPDVRLSRAANLKEFYALPLLQELQSLAWDTRGLKPESIPEGLLRQSAEVQRSQTFSRAADQVRAELRSVEKITDDFQVRLADIAVSWTSDLRCYGAATFDIEPAGNTSCRLALPANYQIVNLCVDGRPLRFSPAGDARWQVPLSGGRLPQRIEVVFVGQWSSDKDVPRVIEGPKLIGLPVERTLWTISGPHWAGASEISNGDAARQIRLDAARFESTAGLIETAVNSLAEAAPDEAPRWYTPWARRMLSSRESLRRSQVLADGIVDDFGAQAELIEEDQAGLAERIGTADVLKRLAVERPLADSATQLWERSLKRSGGALYAELLGESSAITVDYAHNRASDLAIRIVAVLVTAILLLAAVAIVLYTPLVEWAQSRPRAVGVLAGLFWWLFLSPSAFGWLIVALCLLLPRLERLARRILRVATRSLIAST